VIDTVVPFVALPAAAIGRFVRIVNEANGRTTFAVVLDKGPWNVEDTAYVFGDARPQAETGTDTSGRITNHAGIDFGEAVWIALGMTDNGPVGWEFLG